MLNSISKLVVGLSICFATALSYAATTNQDTDLKFVRDLIQDMINANSSYKDKFTKQISAETLNKQTPSTTAILCADSRVDSGAISDTPEGTVFVIRNIGNQAQTAYGSVEYGVLHLHTPVLLVVGHSQCGAVKAAMSDYSKETDSIKTELDHIDVNPKDTLNNNVVHNVNNQVKLAMDDLQGKTKSGDLVVIGMVYDLHNDFKFGNGALILVNINNETDPAKLAASPYIKGLKNINILK